LREELGYEFMNAFIEIKSGARGAFEVYVDDVLIFSKLKLDRFPNDGEVVQLIRSK
jgi:selT/selW/selH-like putative selenoprotein|tara:strand:- start:317 stop:484 length:168 start_codon:yes stop_codon:yes gene_type:complete